MGGGGCKAQAKVVGPVHLCTLCSSLACIQQKFVNLDEEIPHTIKKN